MLGCQRGLCEGGDEEKEDARKIEEAVRASSGDALDRCLPIWYKDESEEEADEEEEFSDEEPTLAATTQMTYEQAKAWMVESDSHVINTKNFSKENNGNYLLDGGPQALEELELDDEANDDEAYEFYKHDLEPTI